MAPFKVRDLEDYQRLDWQIMKNGAVSLYFNLDILEQSCEWFRQKAYHIYLFDASRWQSEDDFYEDVSMALDIEHCFGLDALNDCLIEVDVPYEGGSVLVFQHLDQFVRKESKLVQGLLDIIDWNSRLFSLLGYRFLALVQVDDPQVTFERVEAHSVMLNPVEWTQRFKAQRAQTRRP